MFTSVSHMMDLAQRIAKMSPGDAASLRRRPLDSSVYWSLPIASEHDLDCSDDDKSTVVRGVAILTPRGSVSRATKRHVYDEKTPFGRAMAISGVSDSRVVRLLDARRPERRKRMLGICQFLASRNVRSRFRLEQMANLILSDDQDARQLVLTTYLSTVNRKQG